MAELLIRLKTNTVADPVKDRMCYKRGDVVVVKPNGHNWGKEEGLPDFAVIHTDRPMKRIESFLAERKEPHPWSGEVNLAEWTRIKARGGRANFITAPTEGLRRLVEVKGKNIPVIHLSGEILTPHTRRLWGVNINALPVQNKKALLINGRAVIPFSVLRLALLHKQTGAKA